MIPPRPFLALAGALALWLGGVPAPAQQAEPAVRYTVRPGDTLIGLSRRYLTHPQDYRTLQQLNRIRNPNRIPIGSVLVVPERLLRIEPASGQIASFRGAVTIDGAAASQGMQVRQGMRIETGANAFVTVRFSDGSAISLPSQSAIRVDRLRRIPLTDSVDRAFRLEGGRTRSTVTPIRNPDSKFQVTTPLSVSAVRGTDFRVGFDPAAERASTEVVGGTVGVAPDDKGNETAVPKGYGVIGTPEGIQPPEKLLPPPELTGLARGDGDTVVITASPVEGASRYRSQLATDTGFHDVIAEAVTDTPGATIAGVGSTPFFVRLTAIAESGLEGLPRTYSSGRRAAPSGPSASEGEAPDRSPSSMTGDGPASSALGRPQPPLR